MIARAWRIRWSAALLCAVVTLVPAAAPAQVACHCFRDREYDPANPGKSDVYLLATTANTFLAATLGMPKGDIVRARMSGTSGEDLWIASYAAARLRTDRGALLGARGSAASWRKVFRERKGPLMPLGSRFNASLTGAGTDVSLARIAAAEMLAARLGTPWAELDALATQDATLQEMVLAAFLGRWEKRPAPAVYEDVKAGRVTWSGRLAALGRVPKQMEQEVPRSLAPVR